MDIRYLWSPLGLCLALAGCGNDTRLSPADAAPGDAAPADAAVADAQPADAAPPVEPSGVDIYFPPPRSRTALEAVTVRGTAMDDDGIAAIHVAGVAATSDDGFATWQATVPLQHGINLLTIDKQDVAGNVTADAAQLEIVNAPALVDARDMVLDVARNRLLVADVGRRAIMAVALDTGLAARLPGGTLHAPGTEAPDAALALDPDQRRLWILAGGAGSSPDTLLTLDLVTGERTVVAGATTGSGVDLIAVSAIAVDAAGNRVLLFDAEHQAVVAVDLATGARSVLTSAGGDLWPPLSQVSSMVVDAARNRLLVVESQTDHLLAVDLTTGDRTALRIDSDDSFWYNDLAGLVLDPSRNRALLTTDDGHWRTVFAMDLATGIGTYVASFEPFRGPPSTDAGVLVLDPDHDRVLAVDGRNEIWGVDLAGANAFWLRELLGSGVFPAQVLALAVDPVRDTVLALDSWDDVLIDIEPWSRGDRETSGRRRILSGDVPGQDRAGTGAGFFELRDMVLDPPRNRALAYDAGLYDGSLVAVDLTTGARSLIEGGEFIYPAFPSTVGSIAMDPLQHAVLGVSEVELLSLDLTTGETTVASANADAALGPELVNPHGLAVDARQRRAIVINDEVSLLNIDLRTGARGILSELGIGPGGERHVLGDTAIDVAHQLILVTQPATDTRPTRAWSVALTGGAATEIAGPTAGTGAWIRGSIMSIAADSRRNLAVVVTERPSELFMVDLVTLQRVIVSE